MRSFDDFTWGKLLSCRMVAQTWMLSIGVGALGILTMVAIG